MHLALCFKRHSSFKRDLLTDSLYTMIYAAATFRRDPPGKYSYSSGSKDPSRPPVRCRSTPFLKKRLSDSGSSPRSVFNAQSCRNVSSFPQLFRRLSRACLGKCSAFRINGIAEKDVVRTGGTEEDGWAWPCTESAKFPQLFLGLCLSRACLSKLIVCSN